MWTYNYTSFDDRILLEYIALYNILQDFVDLDRNVEDGN